MIMCERRECLGKTVEMRLKTTSRNYSSQWSHCFKQPLTDTALACYRKPSVSFHNWPRQYHPVFNYLFIRKFLNDLMEFPFLNFKPITTSSIHCGDQIASSALQLLVAHLKITKSHSLLFSRQIKPTVFQIHVFSSLLNCCLSFYLCFSWKAVSKSRNYVPAGV